VARRHRLEASIALSFTIARQGKWGDAMMLKAAIVNTALGHLAQGVRDRMGLYSAISMAPEVLGTLSNDSIARILLERLCSDGAMFVDVGAHIGSVIDGVRRHSKPSAIVAIEAIPAKAEALRKRFPNVTVHCTAVGDTEGHVSFFVDSSRSGYSSLDPQLKNRSSAVTEIIVPIHRLEALVPAANVDLIKIDVEGAELGVLRGSETIISASRPTVMFESGADEMKCFPKSALWDWIDDHDYCAVVPNRVAHNDPGMTREVFLEAHLHPRRTTNYFAIARERRREIRDRARALLGIC